MTKKKNRQKELTSKVLCSLLAAGVLTVALPLSGFAEAQKIEGQTIENTDRGGGYGSYYKTDVDIVSSTFQNNKNEGSWACGGALAIYGSNGQLTLTVDGSKFIGNQAITTSDIQGIDYSAFGGAMMIKGTKLTITDTEFTDNIVKTTTGKAFAGGGAIYLDATINGNGSFPTEAKIVATKDMLYSGNNVVGAANDWYYNTYGALAQSGGGFMFLDRNASAEFAVASGATLTIGEVGATGEMDSIASAIPEKAGEKYAAITKTEAGTLTINSSLNKYHGTLAVEAGKMNVTQDWTVKNAVTVNGGTLNMANVTLDKIPDKITVVGTDGQNKEYTINNPAQGALVINGGNVNALSIDVTNGSVTMKSGGLTVKGGYTGDLLATDGVSNLVVSNINGMLEAKENGTLNITSSAADGSIAFTKNENDNPNRKSLYLNSGKASINAEKVTFNSANTVDGNSYAGQNNFAAWLDGNSELDIAVGELYIGSKEAGGDRGFQTKNANNKINIKADKVVAYVGDGFINLQGDRSGTSVANIDVKDFEAHTTWGKDDYGVALLQVNEGNTINFTADKALFDGPTSVDGGVFGSGGFGILNVTVNDTLTIDGNICGTYGKMKSDKDKGTLFDLNVKAKNLDMTGDINAGNMGVGNSNHARTTDVEVIVSEKGVLNGNINAYERGTISVDLGQAGTLNGNVKADKGVINLGGKLTFDSAKTNFTTASDGVINLSSGEMDGVLNIAQGSSVSLSGATFTANDLATSVTGGGKLVLTGNGTLATTAGQVFSVGDATKAGTDLTGNAVTQTAKDKVTFTSGTLKLTDAEYSLDYVASAGAALKAGDTGSKTNVMMSGKLVENGEIKEEITIDQVTSVGDALLDDVVVKDDSKNILIGTTLDSSSSVKVGEVEIGSDSKTVATGFSASKLDLGAGSTGVVLTNKEELNLGGSKGGELVTVGGSAATDGVNLVIGTETAVGSATETAGTLNIGKFTAPETENKLTGAITVNDGSAVNVVNGNLTVTNGVTLAGGTVAVGNGVLNADITAKQDTTSTVTGEAVVSKLEAASGAVLNLGADDKAAHVTVEKLELKGGTLFLDPVWKDGNQIGDGTKVAIAEAHTNGIDGKVVVGQNSTLSLGTKDTGLAEAAFAKTGLTWGDKGVLAAVYLANTIKLNNGSGTEGGLYVDPTAAKDTSVTDNTVTFNKGSLLMVDGAKVTANAAISGIASTGSAIADGAVLYIDGAKKGETYKILAGTDTGWADKDIIADNKLLAFTGDTTSDNKFDVEAKLQKVNAVLDNKVVIGNVVDTTLAGSDENSAAYKFFNNAVSSKFNATDAEAVNALNSFANMGELAGVSRGTYSMSNIMTDAVGKHLSLAGGEHQDTDIWAHYVHNKEDVRDMDMGGMQGSYDLKYNGIVVGGDFYNQGKTTAGVALSYAKGDVNSVGNTVNTKNDAEYYGISLYGRINNGDSAVLGDISYLHGKNDITQNNSGMDITASPKSDAFSIGVKAEKTYALGDCKLVPFAGLRYLHLGVGDYSNSLGMHYNADDQNLWLLPVGVTYSYETKAGDWTIRPLVEAGYVWTAGDRSTDQTVSLNGASDGFGYNVADSGSFVGRFALEAEKANVTFGLGYEYQKGDSVKANRLMANVSFSF